MSRAGIVPGIRTFGRRIVEPLKNKYGKIWLQLFQHDAKCGTHNPRSNQDNIRFFFLLVHSIKFL
jgi:hypothetical protein